MAKKIIAATPTSLADFLDVPAKPQCGRPPAIFNATDMAPAILKNPINSRERESRVKSMRKHGYLVPVDEHMEFMTFEDTESIDAYTLDAFNLINWS